MSDRSPGAASHRPAGAAGAGRDRLKALRRPVAAGGAPGEPSPFADGAAPTAAGGWVPEPIDVEVVDGPAGGRGAGRSGPWGALAAKWVPDGLRGARIDPGRRGAALLSVVAALAAVIAAVGVWWSRPTADPVPDAAPPALLTVSGEAGGTASDRMAAPARSSGAPEASADAPADGPADSLADAPAAPTTAPPAPGSGPILVSVTGRVRNPGVVTVPADARVADAIAAAGGVLDTAELTGLNLAAHVADGASVVVAGPGGSSLEAEAAGGPGPLSGATAAGDNGAGRVNINTADVEALQQLSGVGPVTAGAIVEYRTRHGRFTDLRQLQEVSGIGPVSFARIAPHATL